MTERVVMKRISVYRVAGVDTDSLLGILSNFVHKASVCCRGMKRDVVWDDGCYRRGVKGWLLDFSSETVGIFFA
jgi:hypothetical protein